MTEMSDLTVEKKLNCQYTSKYTDVNVQHQHICSTDTKALFDSGATLSSISRHFYDKVHQAELDRVKDMDSGPPL